jgi:hypothetical protein
MTVMLARWALAAALWCAGSIAAASPYQHAAAGYAVDLAAPAGMRLCVMRPRSLWVAADCEGVDPSAAEALPPAIGFIALVTDGPSSMTLMGLHGLEEHPHAMPAELGEAYARGLASGMMRQGGLAEPRVEKRFEVLRGVQVIRATLTFPRGGAQRPDEDTRVTAAMVGRASVTTLVVSCSRAQRARAEALVEALLARSRVVAPAGPIVWQTRAETTSYHVGRAVGQLVGFGVILASVFALLHRRAARR